jgi:hypothetical protein
MYASPAEVIMGFDIDACCGAFMLSNPFCLFFLRSFWF